METSEVLEFFRDMGYHIYDDKKNENGFIVWNVPKDIVTYGGDCKRWEFINNKGKVDKVIQTEYYNWGYEQTTKIREITDINKLTISTYD